VCRFVFAVSLLGPIFPAFSFFSLAKKIGFMSNTPMKPNRSGLPWVLFWLLLAVVPTLAFAEKESVSPPKIQLVQAVMCEFIENYEPKNIAVVFSMNGGRVSCYTSFTELVNTTYVDHRWYRRDELVTSKRLTLKPPSWSTYSSIQLREADKGPWRVEVWGAEGQLIKTLRFSVSD
jgi:hypothetical protein